MIDLLKTSLLFAAIFLSLLISGCDRAPDCGLPALATRNACDGPSSTDGISARDLILNYLSENNLTAEETDSGLFFRIIADGNGSMPVLGNTVTIDYTGYYRNGCLFDSNNSIDLDLLSLIPGWQQGLPLLDVCGSMQLFIIPELGYGAEPNNGILDGEPLIFDINLLDFE